MFSQLSWPCGGHAILKEAGGMGGTHGTKAGAETLNSGFQVKFSTQLFWEGQ